jgi:DNA-binding IclR family transcriptional regulator
MRYAVPALDKGLDVIELLARENEGLTLNEIARLLDRTSSELFRMVNALARRGYIGQRDSDRYSLTQYSPHRAHRQESDVLGRGGHRNAQRNCGAPVAADRTCR